MTWTCRTASAQWAGRYQHTSVVDAAGAIYVLGGYDSTDYQDVWASTDGGPRPDSVGGGVVGGTLGGYSGATSGVPQRVLPGVTEGVLRGYYRGALGVLSSTEEYLGVLRGT